MTVVRPTVRRNRAPLAPYALTLPHHPRPLPHLPLPPLLPSPLLVVMLAGLTASSALHPSYAVNFLHCWHRVYNREN